MSRRPNPAADRAAQNTQTLKSLVKLEGNKSCADCKRNKHPRWASWNLGIFVCIRCSGIHRGMGTHISRVKSVDLDSWTDEQLQSMLRWGNSRANKYWEAKLAPGHVPSESKIENFIRTKYDSKRWVMDGPMPDPATLDVDGDDDVPLNVVQEKAKLERSSSQRAASAGNQSQTIQPPNRRAQNVDLFGDDPTPPRPSTGPPISRAAPPKAEPAPPPKQARPADSLLGLDFFGGSQSAPPARPSSTTQATSSVPSRPDLKQSILSLYASAPKPPPQPQVQHGQSDSFGGLGGFGGMQSPPPQQQSPQQSGLGGMDDAFSNLNFNPQPTQQQPKPSAFSDLASFSSSRTASQSTASSAFGGGGSFFDTLPKSPPTNPAPLQQRTFSSSSGFGDFTSMTSPAPAAAPKPAATASSGMGDLFDLSMPSSTPAAAQKPAVSSPSASMHSAFNLSAPSQPAQPKPAPAAAPSYSGFSNMDAWGSTDAWATPNTTTPAAPSHTASTSSGWGSSAAAKPTSPKIGQDEDFGGWSSAAPALTPARSTGSKPMGGMGGDDLFSNVWE